MRIRKSLAVALATVSTALVGLSAPAAHAGADNFPYACQYTDDSSDIVFYAGKIFAQGTTYCVNGYELAMRSDGVLAEYNSDGRQVFATGTGGNDYAIFQTDGNLVIYGDGNQALWSTGSYGNTNATLAFQQDGNIVIYTATTHRAVWASGTNNS